MVCDCLRIRGQELVPGVLILILLEYGLRRQEIFPVNLLEICLNPYSIGIWSATTGTKGQDVLTIEVLILILLEYGLRQSFTTLFDDKGVVLILILLEYGLRLA